MEQAAPECGRCKTPMVEGHGMVCALTWISDIAFAAGVILLGLFWTGLLIVLTLLLSSRFALGPIVLIVPLAGANAGLLMLLSVACGMRAKWLRHDIVLAYDGYLDEDGSCCGGSCAGSCLPDRQAGGSGGCDDEAGCGEEGCSPEGCDDPECCKKTDGAGGCGNGQCCKG